MTWSSSLFAGAPTPDDDDAWVAGGLMALSGPRDGPGRLPPRSLVPSMRGLARSIATLTGELGTAVRIDPFALLAERAAAAGSSRSGRRSCGGATDLLRAADGWIALSLARPDDVDLLPPWLGVTRRDDVAGMVLTRQCDDLVASGSELGLPVARLGEVAPDDDVVPAHLVRGGAPRTTIEGALVVDLSSLWAGPLCASVLASAGARVVKVESTSRPDGARWGPAAFFDRLHDGHDSVALDFADAVGRGVLRALLARADIVIEASRPRALAQLGVGRATFLADAHDLVWVSITGYGRTAFDGRRVAFGDDAAVAGGLITGDRADPSFCADAVADPLSGLAAAAATLDRWRTGGNWSIDVSMARVAAWCGRSGPELRRWEGGPPASPRRPAPGGVARPMGADTEAIRREIEP